jgi:hypothetical protein
MKNIDLGHKRYYIYRHIPGSFQIEYRQSIGKWTDNFKLAHMVENFDHVVSGAKRLKKISETALVKYNFCIGEVTIMTNGMFSPVLVD